MFGQRRAALVLGVTCVLTVAGCGGDGTRNSVGSRVHEHAVTAGHVMTGSRGPLPARAVAASVTGLGRDGTIDALEAVGSTYAGSVTLRITVTEQKGDGTTEQSTSCFRYTFAFPRTSDWGVPHEVACGSARSIDVTRPPLPRGVDADTRRKVLDAVRHLSTAQQAQAAVLIPSVRAALGPDFTVEGSDAGKGAFGWVRYGDGCLSVDATSTILRVSEPIHGNDCFGG